MSTRYVFPNGAQTLAVLERAVQTHSTDASAHYLLGNMRLQSGLVDEAVAEWRSAQRLNPRIPVLNASLGRTTGGGGVRSTASGRGRAAAVRTDEMS